MTMLRSAATLGASLAVLAGCSGGGGGSDDPPPTYDELLDQAQTLADEASDAGPTDPAVEGAPSGTARYDGAIGLESNGAFNGADVIVGELRLDADFGDASVSGSAGSFVTETDERFDGSLDITAGTITVAANSVSVTADLDGVLTDESDTDYAFDGGLLGGFGGEEYRYLSGIAGATVTSSGVASGALGIFATER